MTKRELDEMAQQLKTLALRVAKLERAPRDYFDLPMTAIVTVREAAERLGIAEWAFKQGKQGTKLIPRYSNKPIKFVKRDVENFFAAKNRSAADIAREEMAKANPRRRSILKRKAA